MLLAQKKLDMEQVREADVSFMLLAQKKIDMEQVREANVSFHMLTRVIQLLPH